MAGLEIRQRGRLLDGSMPRVVQTVMRSWVQGVLGLLRDHARSIAPVLTGRYRTSLTYRTRISRAGLVEGELSSDDIPGKVRVIEFGFPPARVDLRGRVGRFVFRDTFAFGGPLIRTQGRVLTGEVARELSR